ncbi:SdrD B-like domain-containing protein [Microbacterium sp. I2]|uniref:SdrD B-like domain-containing protein n=1 Tax=Microbacterium sp. I2 TaxID=3391826 RepID=UPI003EDB6637
MSTAFRRSITSQPNGGRGRWRAPLAALTAAALAMGGVVVTTAPAHAAPGQVTGTVFRDFNGNGVFDSGSSSRSGVASDEGIAGVTVTATDGSGDFTGTALTSADGSYELDTTGLDDGTALRVEFSAWPDGFEPSGTAAADATNGTSVQFVEAGAENVDFALNVPQDYAQDAAPLVTAIQRAGSPLASEGGTAASINGPAIAGTPFERNYTGSQPGGFPDRVTLATFGEVGAVSALAYQPASDSILAFATYKRQSGLGSLGLGGIYRVSDVLDENGELSDAGSVTPWLDVTDLGIDLGTAQTNVQRSLSSPTTPVRDAHGFANTGKVGFGGVTISPDGNTLYFINLHDKKLYALDVSDIDAPPTSFESYDLGLGVGERPWAVDIYQDRLFVGYVDSGETDAGAQPGQSAAAAGLSAHVLAAPIDELDTFTEVANVGLGYAKGDVYQNTLAPQSQRWNTWTDTWAWAGGRVSQSNGGWQIYPQPVLSDFYIDEDGYLTAAFTDRTALQGGNRNWSSEASIGGMYETGSSGDILIAAPDGDGTFTFESNAVAGDRTGTTGGVNEGPGGREFYNDRLNVGNGTTHREIALGSVGGQRGTGTVVSTTYDPLAGIRLAGLAWYDVTDGSAVAGYELTGDGGGTASADGTFQKGGGLGSVSLLARQAPVEIGNRVWFDADQDGAQDADEPSIEGVSVELRDADGNVVATTTTDAAGEYYFRSDEDGFEPAGDYTVVFVKPEDGTLALRGPNADLFGDVDWADTVFTQQGGGTTTTDSNADAGGEASVTVTGPGYNDHTIDAGFRADVAFTVQKLIGDGGDPAPAEEFTIDLDARDFRGDPLPLNPSSVTLSPDETSPPITLPVGSSVSVTEDDEGLKNVTITDPAGAAHDGYYRLQGTGSNFAFRVTNTLFSPGAFEVTKAVTGAFDLDSAELADATFTVAYTYAGGGGQLTLDAGNDWTATSPAIPYGTPVTLSELTITGAGPSVGFGTPSWSTGDRADGTAVITIGDGTTAEVTLTNPTTELAGGFAVTKDVTGDGASRVPAATEFVIEYSIDGGASWTPLPGVNDGEVATGPADIPAGTEVLLREQAPAALPDVEWSPAVFSGTGIVDNGDGTATLTIVDDVVAAVLLENPTTPLNGQFSIAKDVTGPGQSLVIGDPEFVVDYTSVAGNGQLRVRDGQTTTSPALPTGTVVTITEVTPAAGWLPAGAAWAAPVLRIDGVAASNGATLTIGDATVVEVEIVNPTTVTPSVAISKGDGDADAGTIAHEADTVADGETYAPGETRDIVIRVQNTGPEPLREVELSDTTLAGGVVENLVFTYPDGSSAAAALDAATGEWTASWAATFEPGTATWAPGDVIVGVATLTIEAGAGDQSGPHQNRATVDAVGALSGTPVGDENDYNAFTGGIQVIKYDGEKADPQVTEGDGWVVPQKPLADAAQDANTLETAVSYPVNTERTVRWVVTNTGDTWLTNLALDDTTLAGPAIGDDWTADLSALGGPADYSFAEDGPWQGLFAPGASFFAEGTLALPAETQHADRVDVVGTVVVPAADGDGIPTDEPALDGETPVPATNEDGSPFTVDDDDPFHAETGVGPIVDIQKGDGTADGDGAEIVHEADTLADGEAYQPGETRTVVIEVTNTGDEPLVDVVLTDATISGGTVQGMEWTLPDGTALDAALDGATGVWTASWPGVWQPEETITGLATLTLGASSAPHVDRAAVTARGQASGIPVGDQNDYNAFTGDIQVIKYDGLGPDPVVTDDNGWVVPEKPLKDAAQDANDIDHAVKYPVGVTNPVRWVVTNTGDTWLTDITLTDVTGEGPAIGGDWTADLSAFGGPADYSFAESGPWQGLLPPDASFFAEGQLTLEAETRHADTVDVMGTVVVPAVGDDGTTPNGEPLLDGDEPVRATVPDPENPEERVPFTVDDDDPFHAWTGVGPYVDIEKGDGQGTAIAHDADTMADGELYENGEARTIVLRVTNTGDEDLADVVLLDENVSGAQIESLVWTLPNGDELVAVREGAIWSAAWDDTFTGDAVWQPGEVITGTATLTLTGGEPHVDRAAVDARGAASGIPASDTDDYNAFTSGVQVIKYDGEKADPAVKDAEGDWITPVKPLVDAAQDANDRGHAVKYEAGAGNTVRWVVTNTGSTWLTAIDLADVTGEGPAIGRWTADLSAFGGPAAYDFVANGTWHGLIPPGASFFAEGTLVLGEDQRHADTVTVEVTPVVPAVDEGGVPTGEPMLGEDGTPVVVTDADGAPVRLTDSDPFHAWAPGPLAATGAALSAGAWLLVAMLLLVLGALGVLSARRRRSV